MNKSRPKLVKPSLAAILVAQAAVHFAGADLSDYIKSLAIKPHGKKNRNSGRGQRILRGSSSNFTGLRFDSRECVRRRNQIARGIIPANLVHPV